MPAGATMAHGQLTWRNLVLAGDHPVRHPEPRGELAQAQPHRAPQSRRLLAGPPAHRDAHLPAPSHARPHALAAQYDARPAWTSASSAGLEDRRNDQQQDDRSEP